MKKIYALLIAVVAAPTLMFAQPGNSTCDTAPVSDLVIDGAVVTSTGSGTDAIDSEDLGEPHVWEAFTITDCADVTIDMCGTTLDQTNFYTSLINVCPIELSAETLFNTGDFNTTSCDEGANVTATWINLPAGTYYYPVMSSPDFEVHDDYTINFMAVTCTGEPDTCLVYAGGPYNDFNTAFGGAPVPDDNGDCDTFQITDFESWASESYTIDGFEAGVMYTFSICEGPGAGSWDPEISVTDPDGNVVAYAVDCAITWTAETDGTYVIGISESGNCFASTNVQTDNGYPTLMCEGTDGIFDADKLENISIYPNPSNGVFNVMNSGAADTYQIRVFDITGKQVVEEQVVLTNGGQYTIDLGTAAKGVYTVQFVSPSNTGAMRVVKN